MLDIEFLVDSLLFQLFNIPNEISTVILLRSFAEDMLSFSLLWDHFLVSVFNNLTKIFLCVDLFHSEFIELLGLKKFFFHIWEVWSHYSFRYSLYPFLFLPPSGPPIFHLLACLVVSHNSPKSVIFYFILHIVWY